VDRIQEEVREWLKSQFPRYVEATGDPSPTGTKVLRWLQSERLPFPNWLTEAVHKQFLTETMSQVFRGDPDMVCVRVVKPSGEETELWTRRQRATPEFLAEAQRQQQEDWSGDCPPEEAFSEPG
jgi:hypothetical protein